MDLVSHVLIGRALSVTKENTKRNIYLVTFFSFAADLPQFILYIYLGFINSRAFFIPFNVDWNGFRSLNPVWSSLWEIPHSLFFLFLVVIPVVFFYKLPKMAFFAYLLHILIDLFTHSGEWAVKPFYPLSYQVNGFTDAWAWPFLGMFLSWCIITLIIVIFHFIFHKKIT